MRCGAFLVARRPDMPESPVVRGVGMDACTRCRHYDGSLDIIAIRFACCRIHYACHRCHDELADHAPVQWLPDRFDMPAILCGACRRELTIAEYLSCGNRCTGCGARFNPGCVRHRHFYFQVESSQ